MEAVAEWEEGVVVSPGSVLVEATGMVELRSSLREKDRIINPLNTVLLAPTFCSSHMFKLGSDCTERKSFMTVKRGSAHEGRGFAVDKAGLWTLSQVTTYCNRNRAATTTGLTHTGSNTGVPRSHQTSR